MKSKVSQLINQIDPEKDQCHKCKRYFLREYLREYNKPWKFEFPGLICPNCIKKELRKNADNMDKIKFKQYEK